MMPSYETTMVIPEYSELQVLWQKARDEIIAKEAEITKLQRGYDRVFEQLRLNAISAENRELRIGTLLDEIAQLKAQLAARPQDRDREPIQ
jgi:uncharacterized small protein (DUF1192 family)